jgi:hypothetical protein
MGRKGGKALVVLIFSAVGAKNQHHQSFARPAGQIGIKTDGVFATTGYNS